MVFGAGGLPRPGSSTPRAKIEGMFAGSRRSRSSSRGRSNQQTSPPTMRHPNCSRRPSGDVGRNRYWVRQRGACQHRTRGTFRTLICRIRSPTHQATSPQPIMAEPRRRTGETPATSALNVGRHFFREAIAFRVPLQAVRTAPIPKSGVKLSFAPSTSGSTEDRTSRKL